MSGYFASDMKISFVMKSWPTARLILLSCWQDTSYVFPILTEIYVQQAILSEQYREIRALKRRFQDYAFTCTSVFLREVPVEKRVRAYQALPELNIETEEKRLIDGGKYEELSIFIKGLGRTEGPGFTYVNYISSMMAYGS